MTEPRTPFDSIDLTPGSAVNLRESGSQDGSDWHLQATEHALWLTSPALHSLTVPDESRLELWRGLMALQAMAGEPQGLRVLITDEGSLALQCPVVAGSGDNRGDARASLKQAWSAMHGLWARWVQAFEGRLSIPHALDASVAKRVAVDSQADAFFNALAARVQSDPELSALHLERAEDGSLILESPLEAWVLGIHASAVEGRWFLSTPVALLPLEPKHLMDVMERALRLNSGISMGPQWFISLDDDDSGEPLLMLQGVLETRLAGADDLKAAIGQALSIAAELAAQCGAMPTPAAAASSMAEIMTFRA